MWISLLGCGLIVFACSSMGFLMAYALKLRIHELRELQNILVFIGDEIHVFNRLLPDIFRNLGDRKELRTHVIFKNTLDEFYKGQSLSLKDAFDKGFKRSIKILALGKEEIHLIRSMGEMMEGTDQQGLLRNLNYLTGQLARVEKSAREFVKHNQKLYQTGGILLGLLVCIILL